MPRDEFGGIELGSEEQDEFGGVAVAEDVGSQMMYAPPMPWVRNPSVAPPVPDERTLGERATASLAQGGIGLQQGFHGLGEQGWSMVQAAYEPIVEVGPIAITAKGPMLASSARENAAFARESALEARKRSQALEPLAQEIGGAPIMRTIGQAIPSVAPALAAGPLGLPAAIGASGAQAGAATLSEAQAVFEQVPEERRKGAFPNVEFWDAAGPAALDAIQTAAITAVAGKIFGQGIEGATTAAKLDAIKRTVGSWVKEVIGETLEEGAQQFVSDYVVGQMSYNPSMTLDQAVSNALKAAVAGGVVGAGVVGAVSQSVPALEQTGMAAEEAKINRALEEQARRTALLESLPGQFQITDPRIAQLRLEGVTQSDAEALVAGRKTVKEVVEGNFKVTPSRVVGAEQGHDEAFAEGYNQAIERLNQIIQAPPVPQMQPPAGMFTAERSPYAVQQASKKIPRNVLEPQVAQESQVALSPDARSQETAETLAPPPPVSEPIATVAEPVAPIPETKATAKVESEIQEVAQTEGKRSAAEIKEELIAELQQKLMKAPAEAKPGDTVTVEIPGDGTFKIANNIEALTSIIERAKKIKTDPGKPPGVPKKAIAASARAIAMTESRPSTAPPEPGTEPVGAIATAPPLTPAATPPVALTPKSQRQIIADLAKGLNLPIRFGRLTTRKFAGYFMPRANLIGAKKAIDIPTVSHEVGHKLDQTFGLSGTAAIASELDVLGDPATPGSGSSWTPSKTHAYKMGEGVAEFVRYWMTDPPRALSMAPNTHAAFEAALSANKDFGDVMRQARDDIQTWRNSEPQARLRSQIVSGNPNKTRYTFSQLVRDLVDDLHILRLATEHGAKTAPLDPSKNAYLLARNLRGSYGMADSFVRHGVVDFNTREVSVGTSLSDALKPVAGRLSDFRDWIVAKRAQELQRQGRETGLVASDVDAVVAKFDADPVFQQAFADLKSWNDALLKYAVDAGLVTQESADAMRRMNQDYVPFHRVFEVGAGEATSQQVTGVGMGLNVGKPGSLRALKGSVRAIADPIETMVQNAYTLITASEKAAINSAVADMAKLPDMGRWVERVAAPTEAVRVTVAKLREELEAAGADMDAVPDDLLLTFFRAGRTAPFGENIIRVVRDGKQEFYRLNRDLHDTFKALDLEDAGTLIKVLSAPAQLLRSGVVLEPSFNIANVLRDTFSAAVISKYGSLPFETTFKGFAAMLTKPKAVAEWAAAGGKNSVEAIYFDRDRLKRFLAERISKDLSPAERALIVARSPLTALRYMTSLFEEATRIGEYQIALKKLTDSGMAVGEARRLAAFESRDRQDFAKGGAKTKIIRHMAAFWNAGLQANVKLAQAFKQRPIRTTLQGLAFVTIPKLIEQALNWDDDDYWDRPQWERDLFFLIPIGKDETGHTRFLRIPTPFEVGIIFGTFPGRIAEWMKRNRPDAMEGFPKLMLKNSVPNPIPQAGQMIFEDFLSGPQGWDVWRGRTIVPDSLSDLPPDLQWTEQTSRLAKEVGSRLNYSPMKVDHIIESTTGGVGKLLTGRSDPFSRFTTRPLRVSNQPTEDFYVELERMRMEAARAKTTGEGESPAALPDFERTARNLSEIRTAIRATDNAKEKAELQEEMFRITKELLEAYAEPE